MNKRILVLLGVALLGTVACGKKKEVQVVEQEVVSIEADKNASEEKKVVSTEAEQYATTNLQAERIEAVQKPAFEDQATPTDNDGSRSATGLTETESKVLINGKAPYQVDYDKIKKQRIEWERKGHDSGLTGACLEALLAREDLANHAYNPARMRLEPGQTVNDGLRAQLEGMKKSELEDYSSQYRKMSQSECEQALDDTKRVYIEN